MDYFTSTLIGITLPLHCCWLRFLYTYLDYITFTLLLVTLPLHLLIVLPLHCCALQSAASCADPLHVSPLCAGAGLSQFLDLTFVPPPQLTVQTLHPIQAPQAPSTAKGRQTEIVIV